MATLWAIDSRLFPPFPEAFTPLLEKKQTYEAELLSTPQPARSGLRFEASLLTTVPGEKLLLTIGMEGENPVPALKRGDRIRFEAQLKRPTHYQNPGGFDYRRELERKNIFLTGFIPPHALERLPSPSPSVEIWERLRLRLAEKIETIPDQVAAAFLKALLLGDRTNFTPELWEAFRKTGTAHLIAISGQHIGLLFLVTVGIFLMLFRRSERLMLLLSIRRLSLLLSLPPIIFYLLLAGSPPSAVRAVIMTILLVTAFCLKRRFDPYTALAAAVLFLLLMDRSTLFGLSLQLSFLAVLAMLLLAQPIICKLREMKQIPTWLKKWILSPSLLSIAATIGTAPLIALQFHTFPLNGLLTNLWAVPATGVLLIASGIALPFSLLLPSVGTSLLQLTGLFSGIFLDLIQKAASWSVVLELYPTQGEALLVYGIILLAILSLHSSRFRRPALLLSLLLCLGFIPIPKILSRQLEVTFIDVGQGDAALLQTPQGKTILIDGGGFLIPGRPVLFDVGTEVVVPYLKQRGIRKLDLVILSHPHPDHYGGLKAVTASFPIGEFWWNGQRFPDQTFDRLMETLNDKGIPLRQVSAPLKTSIDSVLLEVLHPEKLLYKGGINNNCLVLRVVHGKTSFLFAGDIEREAEEELVSLPRNLRSTVLKIPHHGSRTSSSVPLIDKISPQYAIVSLQERNMFHFPHEGVLEKYKRRGIQVLRTDLNGAITFRSDGENIELETYRQR